MCSHTNPIQEGQPSSLLRIALQSWKNRVLTSPGGSWDPNLTQELCRARCAEICPQDGEDFQSWLCPGAGRLVETSASSLWLSHCPGSLSCVPLPHLTVGPLWGRAALGVAPAGSHPPRVPAVVSDLCATGDHDCEQVCVSTPGTYRCACRDGFSLNSDGKTCTGV